MCPIRLIKDPWIMCDGAVNEHHCRRVAGGPFDLRGTLAEPLGLEVHSCLLALDSFLTFSMVHEIEESFFSTPAVYPRRFD